MSEYIEEKQEKTEYRKVWLQGKISYGVTLPKKICEDLGIKPGDWIIIKRQDNKIEITKANENQNKTNNRGDIK